jgi:DNA-binding NtrC family response regulator
LRSDFRLVVASHEDLAEKVRAGKFREDLFFRIAVFDVELPPLRSRGDDVMLLVDRFVKEKGAASIRVADDAREALVRYDYPGNVRELRNAIERALVVCEGGELRAADLPARMRAESAQVTPKSTPPEGVKTQVRVGETVGAMEGRMLEEALERTNWNVAEVVKQLGIGRTTVYRRIKELGLTPKR